jgi:HSP20 family protein
MRALAPFARAGGLMEEMDRLLDRVFDFRAEFPIVRDRTPRFDLTETKDTLVVIAEVPGIDPGQMTVNLTNGVLTLTGEKKDCRPPAAAADTRHYHSECTYGRFQRKVWLPANVDEAKTTATFKDGVLTITMTKTPAPAGTAVPVTTTG